MFPGTSFRSYFLPRHPLPKFRATFFPCLGTSGMVKKCTHALLCSCTLNSSGHRCHQGPGPEPAQSIPAAAHPQAQRHSPSCRAATSQGAHSSNSQLYFAAAVWVLLQKYWGLTTQFTFGKETNRELQLLFFHVWPFKIPCELLNIKNMMKSQSLVMPKTCWYQPLHCGLSMICFPSFLI